MPYQLRRFECNNLSGIPSFDEIARFPDLNSAVMMAKVLFQVEYGSNKFAPLYFHESLASFFNITIPKEFQKNNGFPISWITTSDDINELLDDWWESEEQFIMYPYWEIVSDNEVSAILAPYYCYIDNRIFLDMFLDMYIT